MEYLPLFFDVRGRTCAVVGGNATAARKAELLMRAGARVRVIADGLGEALTEHALKGRIEHTAETLGAESFNDCVLAVIALEDEVGAARAAKIATSCGIPVNVVDRPQLCSCIMPAIVDRSPVLVAISTAGAAPVLGRFLRARLEALLPRRFGALAQMARELRPEVAERLAPERRRYFWESVLQGPASELVFSGRDDEARALMRARLAEEGDDRPGEVYLVATPPSGDAEAFTLRSLRLLQQADVVIHDQGLEQPVLDLIRRDAERRSASGRRPQVIIDELTALAREGRRAGWLTAAAHLRNDGGPPPAERLRAAGVEVYESV